jgi:hypothetical protein
MSSLMIHPSIKYIFISTTKNKKKLNGYDFTGGSFNGRESPLVDVV